MTKKMRELQNKILEKTKAASALLEGENKDLDKAAQLMDEIDSLQKELDLNARLENAEKADVPEEPAKPKEKASGFRAIVSKLFGRDMTDEEKSALITGDDAAAGENYLVPEDVRLAINELRQSFVSAKNLVTVETTTALSGSFNYEAGTYAGLTSFDDGDAITEETNVAFTQKTFAIKFFGKLIPISRILLKNEKAGLLNYLKRWFVKNAILTENAQIFSVLKSGYNSGTPKALAGWKAFKKSITTDLDPSVLLDACIITNQSGFACLDEEEDADGRPVLQENPANRTQKMFQSLPVYVFPDAQLANIDSTHFPMIYGSTKAGCTFVEREALEFATSEHYGFNKNQNYLRVIEGFDVIGTDTAAYIYGKFSATPTT